MSEYAPSDLPAERRLDLFINRQCVCGTCIHGIERNLFGYVFCEQEGMAGGWNPAYSSCEEHDFRDPKLAAKLESLMDKWYAEAEVAGEFDIPAEASA